MTQSLFLARRILLAFEYVITAAFLLLLFVLNFAVGWGASLGAFVAFCLGMAFALTNDLRRGVRLVPSENVDE